MRDSQKFHTFLIVQCSAESLGVFTNTLLRRNAFLCCESCSSSLSDLLTHEPRSLDPFSRSLMEIGDLFFRLLKRNDYLLLCKLHKIFVYSLQYDISFSPCHSYIV